MRHHLLSASSGRRWTTLFIGLALMVTLAFASACAGPEATPTQAAQPTQASGQTPQEPTPTAEPAGVPNDFYNGKTLRLVVNWPAGSSADLFARVIERHIGRFVPGDPRVVVHNVPGASGLVGALEVFNSDPDGTTLGVFSAVTVGNQLVEPGYDYDMLEAEIILAFAGQTSMWFAYESSPYTRLQEAVGQGSTGGPTFTLGTGDTCSMSSARFRALKEWLDLPLNILYGFEPRRAEVWLQLERGDYQTATSSGWYTLPSDRPGWLTEGKIHPFALLQPPGTTVYEPNSEMAIPEDTLYVTDLLTEEQARLYTGLSADQLGPQHRRIDAPPGTPPEITQMLRDATWEMFHDEEFLEELNQLREDDPFDIRRGEDMQELVRNRLGDVEEIMGELRRLLPECTNLAT